MQLLISMHLMQSQAGQGGAGHANMLGVPQETFAQGATTQPSAALLPTQQLRPLAPLQTVFSLQCMQGQAGQGRAGHADALGVP